VLFSASFNHVTQNSFVNIVNIVLIPVLINFHNQCTTGRGYLASVSPFHQQNGITIMMNRLIILIDEFANSLTNSSLNKRPFSFSWGCRIAPPHYAYADQVLCFNEAFTACEQLLNVPYWKKSLCNFQRSVWYKSFKKNIFVDVDILKTTGSDLARS